MTGTMPPTSELGSLGIAHLKRLWFRRMATLEGSSNNGPNMEWGLDKLVMHGLGVGREQMARFLESPRSFEELEVWVLEMNGGTILPDRIRRLNAALLSLPYDSDIKERLAEIETSPDVLTADEMNCWNQNGLVVLNNAISPDDCAAARNLVYDFVGASPDRPETWYSPRNTQGVLVQIFQHPALEPARRSPRIHKAFAQISGTADLFPTIDRCGFNPPEREGFTFPGPYLHWDLNLNECPIGFSAQGVLYLTDTEAEQGAFTCIPGFHRKIEDWLAGLPASANPRDHIPFEAAKAITGGAGDLIIWHHALPHGSRPNRASAPRIVQYIRMFPPRDRLQAQGTGYRGESPVDID